MHWEKDKFYFKTGRKFYAHGYIGIVENGGEVEIAQGYDGGIDIECSNSDDYDDNSELTIEEKRELSEYMISLWKKFGGL